MSAGVEGVAWDARSAYYGPALPWRV
jgi:hypothetical protein